MYSKKTNQLYIRKIFPHDLTHEVSVSTEIVNNFFEGKTRITFYKGEDRSTINTVTINSATDPRFGGDFASLWSSNGLNVNDFIIIRKINSDEYELTTEKAGGMLHKFLSSMFSGLQRHAIIVSEAESECKSNIICESISSQPLLSALRTKPFLLLAGISGTGKSQKVQELAYMSCPKELQDKKGTTPGNYCLIEVKPNWHDSTELLGYYSALSEKYMLTDFVRFAYKALQHEDVPFFLCLDEMNLAPVEQYFAEYLSVLETRKLVDGEIESQPLLSAEKFANCKVNVEEPNAVRQYPVLDGGEPSKEKAIYSAEDAEIITYLKENGLALPSNLFVIGTVNMDDTTHQFSRKVIDRAFTIEMNGGKMEDMFSEESKLLLSYREEPIPLAAFQSRFVKAYEVLDDAQFSRYADDIKTKIPSLLGNPEGEYNTNSINGVLSGTPFRVSYRVQNELVLYLSTLIESAKYPENIDGLIREAVLAILLQKILPRVQGEESQLKTNGGHSNILADLKSFVQTHLAPIPAPQSVENDNQENAEGEATEPSVSAAPSSELYHQVIKKLDEMEAKLAGYYTNFF